MQLNPKKIIGSLGRRYGGKPFLKVRRVYYDTLAFFNQLHEISYLARGKYAPKHRDRRFQKKYYKDCITQENKNFQPGVICMLDGRMYHGGLTDRLRGILSTYEVVKKKKLPFYIYWEHPFKLEEFLQPAKIDWRIDSEKLVYDNKLAFPFIVNDEPLFHSWLRMKTGLKMWRPQVHVYSNADNGRGKYRQLYNELFRPSEKITSEVEKHIRELGTDYQAYSFRFLRLLGDFVDWTHNILPEEEALALMEKVTEEFFKLTKDIPTEKRILVTADSRRFLDYISQRDSRVYVVPGDVKHLDLTDGPQEEIWLKTFVDQYLLMKASKVTLLKTGNMYKSGFSRFAAEIGGVPFVYHEF